MGILSNTHRYWIVLWFMISIYLWFVCNINKIRNCLKIWYSPPATLMGKAIIHHQVWRYPFLDKPGEIKMKNGGEWWRSTSKLIKHTYIQKTSKNMQRSMSCEYTPCNILWCRVNHQAAQSILPSHWEPCHHFPQKTGHKKWLVHWAADRANPHLLDLELLDQNHIGTTNLIGIMFF